MEKLPVEAFGQVISKLDLKDRLECLTVCKKWNDVISSTNLYQTLSFEEGYSSRGSDRFTGAFKLFNNRSIGNQVRSLENKGCKVNLYSLISLPRLFPKLRYFSWSDDEAYQKILSSDTAPQKDVYASEFAKWIHLEHLVISTYTNIATMIIGSSVFDRLTQLEISFLSVINWRRNESNLLVKSFFQDTATNLPVLKVLHLGRACVDLEDMEKLHNGAPNPERIVFHCVQLMETPSALTIIQDGGALLNAEGRSFVHGAAIKVKTVSIALDDCVGYDNRLSTILAKRIVYTRLKYPNTAFLGIKPNGGMMEPYNADSTLE